MNHTVCITLSLLALSAASCTAADTDPVRKLRDRLVAVQKSGRTMFGHHDDTAYGFTWRNQPGRSDVLEVAGDYPAVMSWDLGMIELGDSVNLDSVPFALMRREIAAHDARGGINTISWHPRNPITGGDSWDCTDTLTVRKILTDSVTNKKFRSWVGQVAGFLNSLKSADGDDVAVIFRPWHEMSGSWFWWGGRNCSPEDYKALWNLTASELRTAGVDNLLWAYSPDRVNSKEQYLTWYPGDDKVDIVGTDVYHFNAEDGIDEYVSTVRRSMGIVNEVAAEHGKIPAFSESGLETLTVTDWYTRVFLPLIRETHPVYTVVWRNADNKPGHFYVPYPGHPDTQSFKDFTADPAVMMLSNLKDINF